MRAISLAEVNEIIAGTFGSARSANNKPMRWRRSCSTPAAG
jgi:hypothetical protein